MGTNSVTFIFACVFRFCSSFFFFSFLLALEIGDTDLNRKISLCRELLDVAKILEPGRSIFRGKLLVDLQEALYVQTERLLSNRDISSVVAHVSFVFFFHSKYAKRITKKNGKEKYIQLLFFFYTFRNVSTSNCCC